MFFSVYWAKMKMHCQSLSTISQSVTDIQPTAKPWLSKMSLFFIIISSEGQFIEKGKMNVICLKLWSSFCPRLEVLVHMASSLLEGNGILQKNITKRERWDTSSTNSNIRELKQWLDGRGIAKKNRKVMWGNRRGMRRQSSNSAEQIYMLKFKALSNVI